MRGKSEIIEVTISQLDWHIINQVKTLRKKKGISQDNLSVKIGFSEKFIGSIENPTAKKRFNIGHLNLLAKALDCSLWDLVPETPFAEDYIKVKVRRTALPNDGKKLKGKTRLEILEAKPIKNRPF